MIRRLGLAIIAAVLALMPLGVPAAAVFDVPTDDFYSVNEDQELVVGVIDGVFSNDLTSRGQCVVATDVTGLQGHLPLDSLGEFGQFRFSPSPDFNGVTSFKYTLGLVGSSCEPVPEPNEATVTITVFEINDPPAIELNSLCANGVTVDEDSGPFTDSSHCVEMLNFGPSDESSQGLEEWVVTSTKPELFASKPKISPVDDLFGRLAFTPAANAHGTSTVTVMGRDGASASDGGDDLSDPLKFKITITAVDDPTAEPTIEPPTDEPTSAATAEPSSPEPTDPGPSTAATLAPSEAPTAAASPAPEATASDSGGSIVPIALGILLVVLVIGFGAALLVPKWRAGRGT